MPSRSASSSNGNRLLASIVGTSVAYAALRYNVFAGVPWSEFPLYVLNKGIALSGAVLIALSYMVARLRLDGNDVAAGRALARFAGLSGFALSIVHVLASIPLLNPGRYPSLYEGASLSTGGWTCLVAGGIATALFALPAIFSIDRFLPKLGRDNWKRAQQTGYIGLAMTAVHIFPIGAHNWLSPASWPGGLPPISLISFVVCVVPIGAKLSARLREAGLG